MRSASFQVKRFSANDWEPGQEELPGVSHLVLRDVTPRYGLGLVNHFPLLQRLEVATPEDVIHEMSSGEGSRFFRRLASQCPLLEWLDVVVRVKWVDDDDVDTGPSKVYWPDDRQTLQIVYHNNQPEGEDVGWLEPWRLFRSNVTVIDDPGESKEEAEAKWIVSPYQSFL